VSFQLEINGQSLLDPGPVLVQPGHRNRLTATSTDGTGHGLRLRMTAGDGRVMDLNATAEPGELAQVELGPMAVPAMYEFEHGVVYRRGYHLMVEAQVANDPVEPVQFEMYEGLSKDASATALYSGAARRVVFNDGYVPTAEEAQESSAPHPRRNKPEATSRWFPFGWGGISMAPPIELRLAAEVLIDRNNIRVRHCLRAHSPEIPPIGGKLVVSNESGQVIWSATSTTTTSHWAEIALPAEAWPEGDYRIELRPWMAGRDWDGPVVTYHRRSGDDDGVQISAFAPFSLNRDRSRAVQVIDNWSGQSLAQGWEVKSDHGRRVLVETGDQSARPQPLELPDLSGHYAVFGTATSAFLLRLSIDGVVREVVEAQEEEFGRTFITATDLSAARAELVPTGTTGEGISELHFVPVTAKSIQKFRKTVENPQVALRGVLDWHESCRLPLGNEPGQAVADYVDAEMHVGSRELGMQTIGWSLGRSTLEYPSKLPDGQGFPGIPLTRELLEQFPYLHKWQRLVEELDPLAHVLASPQHAGMRVMAWLSMNRHYGLATYDGALQSPWSRAHPELLQHTEDGNIDPTRVEFFFPEARKERVDILTEVAEYGPDGLIVGCCRQPPMAGYHPEVVQAYIDTGGEDPRTVDVDANPIAFAAWLRWRCEGLTQLLRELAKRLSDIEDRHGRHTPVAARISAGGLFWNMANGMDVVTWVQEGLVNELQVDPLDDHGPSGSQDLRPYVELGRKHGVPVLGGVSMFASRSLHGDFNPVVGIRRAIGVAESGVDGIEIYESENLTLATHHRWLVPLWGQPELARRWLDDSNLEAVYPISSFHAAGGHDNHWFYSPPPRLKRAIEALAACQDRTVSNPGVA